MSSLHLAAVRKSATFDWNSGLEREVLFTWMALSSIAANLHVGAAFLIDTIYGLPKRRSWHFNCQEERDQCPKDGGWTQHMSDLMEGCRLLRLIYHVSKCLTKWHSAEKLSDGWSVPFRSGSGSGSGVGRPQCLLSSYF